MINKEAEMILVKSLLHTKETRIDYFISMTNKMGVRLLPFIKSLLDAYHRLKEYVNTYVMFN